MDRSFTVTGPTRTDVYLGFNANPENAQFEITAHDGKLFYCRTKCLVIAISQITRYNHEQFDAERALLQVRMLKAAFLGE